MSLLDHNKQQLSAEPGSSVSGCGHGNKAQNTHKALAKLLQIKALGLFFFNVSFLQCIGQSKDAALQSLIGSS